MAAGAVIYADVRVVLEHPVDAVWAAVAEFGRIDRWAAGVSSCTADGHGPGMIRTVSLAGRKVREQLETIDPAGRSLSYRILPPHGLPAADVRSEINLIQCDDGVAMRWRSVATDLEVPAEQLGARIEGFYRRSIEGLDRLLRGG
ncbi:MAG TPA: SRPBCC family protein [Caulobacteraceae bacterium]|jgi:hypothetical protein